MKKAVLLMMLLAFLCIQSRVQADLLFLDADTPETGSNLDIEPLVTSFGTITFSGEIRPTADDDLINAGSSGDVFDIDGTSTAEFTFDFDVLSFTFIYGGNSGVFDITAFDINGDVVDTFFQGDTGDGEPAGPVTLSGNGIRRIFWTDPGFNFAAIDNIKINAIPEPGSAMLIALSGSILLMRRKRV